MHLTLLISLLATLTPALAKNRVFATESTKIGNTEWVICPPNAAPGDEVCSLDRKKHSVCAAPGAPALAILLKEDEWRCGDRIEATTLTEVILSTAPVTPRPTKTQVVTVPGKTVTASPA